MLARPGTCSATTGKWLAAAKSSAISRAMMLQAAPVVFSLTANTSALIESDFTRS